MLHIPDRKIDAFFITLQKTEEADSPTTMYEDYAISDELFHWQSQSTTSADSPTGQRYIRHRKHGYTPLLFVRERKLLPGGLASPYAFLGPAHYVSHEGSRPLSIVWRCDAHANAACSCCSWVAADQRRGGCYAATESFFRYCRRSVFFTSVHFAPRKL